MEDCYIRYLRERIESFEEKLEETKKELEEMLAMEKENEQKAEVSVRKLRT